MHYYFSPFANKAYRAFFNIKFFSFDSSSAWPPQNNLLDSGMKQKGLFLEEKNGRKGGGKNQKNLLSMNRFECLFQNSSGKSVWVGLCPECVCMSRAKSSGGKCSMVPFVPPLFCHGPSDLLWVQAALYPLQHLMLFALAGRFSLPTLSMGT